mmetsp:Transcript_1982/g.5477  ORF Transcript_1982/g.5477 Transcript_1982/m.5477 type:complete len:269 (+) Transcript_1982:283-1089(+)
MLALIVEVRIAVAAETRARKADILNNMTSSELLHDEHVRRDLVLRQVFLLCLLHHAPQPFLAHCLQTPLVRGTFRTVVVNASDGEDRQTADAQGLGHAIQCRRRCLAGREHAGRMDDIVGSSLDPALVLCALDELRVTPALGGDVQHALAQIASVQGVDPAMLFEMRSRDPSPAAEVQKLRHVLGRAELDDDLGCGASPLAIAGDAIEIRIILFGPAIVNLFEFRGILGEQRGSVTSSQGSRRALRGMDGRSGVGRSLWLIGGHGLSR